MEVLYVSYITANETTKILEITDKMIAYNCSIRLIKCNTCFVPIEKPYISIKIKDGENK